MSFFQSRDDDLKLNWTILVAVTFRKKETFQNQLTPEPCLSRSLSKKITTYQLHCKTENRTKTKNRAGKLDCKIRLILPFRGYVLLVQAFA